jgi:polysaccharide export outer membrane protein
MTFTQPISKALRFVAAPGSPGVASGNYFPRLAVVLLLFAVFVPPSRGQSPPVNLAATASVSPGQIKPSLPAVAAVSVTPAPTTPDTNRVSVLDDQYKLALGDHVSFRIIEDEDDPQDLLVTDTGEIEVPYLGRYPVVGKTCKELAAELKKRLEEKYYYHATVLIYVDSKLTPGLVYLVGPVRTPGPLELPRDETLTLSKAILRAGGFADLADQKHVRITREGKGGATDRQVLVVNVYQILNEGKTDQDLVLQPGDLVYIPERLLRF